MAPKAGRGEKAWRVVGESSEAKPSEGEAAKETKEKSKGGKKEGGKGKRGGGGKGKETADDGAAPWSKHAEEEEDGSRRRSAKGKGRKGGSKSQGGGGQAQADDYYGEDDGSWGKGWNAGWDSGWDNYGGRQGGGGQQQKGRSKGGGKRDGYAAADYPGGADEDYYEGYDYSGGYGAGYGYGYGPQDWQSMPQQVEPQPPPPPPRKSEWTEYKTPEGDSYYHSSKTGLTQWERPAELDPPKQAEPEVKPQSNERMDGDIGQSRGGGGGRGRGRGSDDHDRDDQRRGGGGEGGGRPKGREGGDGQRKGGRGGGKKDGGGRGGGGAPKEDASDFGPPGCNLFVFHLPDDWTDDDLHEYFAPHGSVVSAKVMKELGTGRSRGFGFVSYEDRVSAATAIKKMQGYKILGKRLKVEFKKGEMEGGSVQDGADLGQDEDSGGPKKSYPDDERLIGYLRAISAKNVVTALKESENPDGADADGAADMGALDSAGPADMGVPDTEDAGFSFGADDAAEDPET